MGDPARNIEVRAPPAPTQGARPPRPTPHCQPRPGVRRLHRAAWLEEGERRLDELESGKVAGIPAEQVLEKARSTLQ